MISSRFLSVLGLAALMAACGAPEVSDLGGNPSTADDDDDDGGTPTPLPGSFSLAITSGPLDLDLNQTADVSFTVTPENGFTGTVTVALPTNAAGLTAEPVNVDITDASAVSGTLVASTLVYKDVIPGNYTDIAVHAQAGSVTSDAMLSALINPAITLRIKAGAGNAQAAPDVWGGEASADGIILHFGKDAAGLPNDEFQISWINDDSVNHTIHAGGNATQHGINHGATNNNNSDVNGDAGGTQTRTINRGPLVDDVPTLDPADPTDEVVFMPNTFYCHNHLGTNLATGHAAKITIRN